MVTLAEEFETLYPISTVQDIFLKGFMNGNYGEFNRHWFNTTSANITPGMGLLRAVAGAEHTVTEWAQHCIVGYGVAGWDRAQLTAQTNDYASADLIPVYPFFENAGAYFQGNVEDNGGNTDADLAFDAGAVGVFEPAGSDFVDYASLLYYNTDTGAAYDENLVFYINVKSHEG